MKFVTFEHQNKLCPGVLSKSGATVFPLEEADMNAVIRSMTPHKLERLQAQAEQESALSIDGVRLHAPIPEPLQDIICIGENYAEHAAESARFKNQPVEQRKHPVIFSKRCNYAVGDGGLIEGHFDRDSKLDYEVELAVIIGRDAKDVPYEKVEEYIFGYTILNDVSARTLQMQHQQWYIGKSLDGFVSMGPWIVTKDEIPFLPELGIHSFVNGELRQNSNTRNQLFDIAYVVSMLSHGMTLRAGTIYTTGTPAGVGMGFVPPKFLKPGDVVRCEVEGVGVLTNTVL